MRVAPRPTRAAAGASDATRRGTSRRAAIGAVLAWRATSGVRIARAETPAGGRVTCTLVTPCTPPPPNGAPRYELPKSTYDPRAEAEARYLEKVRREKGGGDERRE